MDLDSYLGVHAQALLLASRRSELLANNLANADTPSFKARDFDFKAALASAANSDAFAPLPLATTSSAHQQLATVGNQPAPELQYRVPLAPSLDGNTVDVQLEQGAFAENTIRYQTALTLLNGKFRALLTAITGQ